MDELLHGRRIYLTRHGETSDNVKGIARGRHNNTHLTNKGIAGAMALRELIEKLDPPVTVSTSSALERAALTEYMGTLNIPVEHIPANAAFDERDYEENGQNKPNAESYEAHQERVVKGINSILEKDKDCVPLVVCHGGTVRRVMDAIGNFQKAPDYLKIPNASIIEVVTPSTSTSQDWQLNVVTLGEKGIERRPIALNAEMYKRRDDEPRHYRA